EQELQTPVRDDQTDRAAERSEHDAFRQQLTNNAGARCTERAANGDLALANGAAREEKIRHVGARNQQHEGDRAGEYEQRGTVLARQLVVESVDLRRPV